MHYKFHPARNCVLIILRSSMAPVEVWLRTAGHLSTSFFKGDSDAHSEGIGSAHWLNPLRCCAQESAFDNAFVDLKKAIDMSRKATDPVFLAVSQGVPLQQALRTAPRWAWHYESGGKALAHLDLARREMLPFRQDNPALDLTTPVDTACIDSTSLTANVMFRQTSSLSNFI